MVDELGRVICEKCQQILQIGDFPFCPHRRGAAAAFHDDLPGGLTVENYGPHPITFYSHSERRKYMEEHGLREKERFSPMPGTDIDPQGIPNPAGFTDPQTLLNAAALICRNGRAVEFDGEKAGVLRNLTTETVANAEEMKRALNQT